MMRALTFKSPFAEPVKSAFGLHLTYPLERFLELSLSLSLNCLPYCFAVYCQHLEKLKVATSAAHKFEALLVLKVSCSPNKKTLHFVFDLKILFA